MKKKIYIYIIYFPTSGKYYIGQTNNLKKRMFAHLKADSLVGNALRKYDDFKISVLHIARSRDVANTLEIEEIRNFGSVAPNGYNLTHGGEAGIPSEETLQKMRKAQKGENNPNYGKTGEKSPNYGKHPSKETLKKISDALSGEKNPNYGKHRYGEDNPFYGKHHTKETRKKQSEAQKALTDEQKKIIYLKKLKTRIKNLQQQLSSNDFSD